MPALPTKLLASGVERQLHQYEGLDHLRVRARGDVLTIESGPPSDPVRHARLRRETVDFWGLEVAGYGGRWEPTPYRDTKDRLITALVEQFGWVLTPRDEMSLEPGTN